jgi:hypothetical protein
MADFDAEIRERSAGERREPVHLKRLPKNRYKWNRQHGFSGAVPARLTPGRARTKSSAEEEA